MNKKIFLLFGLTVFIALFAMSYVCATAEIEPEYNYKDYYSGGIDGDISVTNAEEKVLKEGKTITKQITVAKEVKTYSKAKTIKIECSKKLTKNNIKKGKIGGQYEKNIQKAKSVLKGSKIKSIKITTAYKKLKDCSGIHKVKIYKATINYKPVVYKTVSKTTKATISLDDDDYAKIKYINPFNGKNRIEYGDIFYY